MGRGDEQLVHTKRGRQQLLDAEHVAVEEADRVDDNIGDAGLALVEDHHVHLHIVVRLTRHAAVGIRRSITGRARPLLGAELRGAREVKAGEPNALHLPVALGAVGIGARIGPNRDAVCEGRGGRAGHVEAAVAEGRRVEHITDEQQPLVHEGGPRRLPTLRRDAAPGKAGLERAISCRAAGGAGADQRGRRRITAEAKAVAVRAAEIACLLLFGAAIRRAQAAPVLIGEAAVTHPPLIVVTARPVGGIGRCVSARVGARIGCGVAFARAAVRERAGVTGTAVDRSVDVALVVAAGGKEQHKKGGIPDGDRSHERALGREYPQSYLNCPLALQIIGPGAGSGDEAP